MRNSIPLQICKNGGLCMIQFFCGRNGSGKTYKIYEKIASESDFDNSILIVPDQSTFINEKKILNEFGATAAARIKVFGLERLYEYLSELYNEKPKQRIDDGAKTVLMSLSAEEVSDKLELYAKKAQKADFAELMLNAVNEYQLCAISPEMLAQTAEKIHDKHLKQKIKESALIYSAYTALVNQAYSDPNDDLTRLYEILCTRDFFRNKRVYIDSFNSFSGQEYKVIEKIIEQADYVGITIGFSPLENQNNDNSIFREPFITMNKLSAFAQDNNIEILPTVNLTEQKRFSTDSLKALEESFFRFDGDVYYCDDNSIQLYEADSEYDEIQNTARNICRLVREKGYSYNEINVICRDADIYRHVIESEFPKYDIPFFMSEKKPLENHSLIAFILSAFDVVHSSFATENILTFLKTDFSNLSPDEVCILENYVYIWDIRGKRWKSPFTMNPDGNSANESEEVLQKLAIIEELREKAVTPLLQFASNLKNSQNGGDISYAVYKLLQSVKAEETLQNIARWFHENGDIKSQETEVRIWNITMDILDKMYNILEHKSIDTKRYAELLELIIRKSPVSDIPQTLDQVTVGLAGNLISENPKAVFIIGAIDGIFPENPKPAGLFSDGERTELISLELPLHYGVYDKSLLEKYNVYSSVSLPSEKLFVSYHTENSKGDKFKPSVIFKEIKDIIPQIQIIKKSDLSKEDIYFTENQSFEECAAQWNKNTPDSNTLKSYFKTSDRFKHVCSAIDIAVKDAPYKISDKKNSKLLFGDHIKLSASQAETYYSCPFSYFCKYGLNVYPRKRAIIDPTMYGSVVHYVLENLLKEEKFDNIRNFDNNQLSDVVKRHIENYIRSIGGSEERLARFMVQFRIMERNLVILLKRLIDEFNVCQFVPESFELKIGGSNPDIPAYDLCLPTGEKISVTGKIDRVDTYVKDNEKYIRIIDYKTGDKGNKTFKLSEVYYGLNMQMLLYLSAINKNGSAFYSENKYTLAPAGILYMPSTPKSDSKQLNSETEKSEYLKKQRENFKMNGLLIKDETILSAMEKDIQGLYIPANKNLDTCKNLVTLSEYGKIFSYIDRKFISMAQSLFDGNIERNPVKKSSLDACKYCDYKTVCGYEKGKKTNLLKDTGTADTITKIEEELNNV